uniref:Thymus, brain and testes associated n=1 Tax=Lepisosteus oculatus TaxID=7918 RepID=W5MC83_LEPOC
MELSVRQRMGTLGDPVSGTFNRKVALGNMKKAEEVSFNNPLRLTGASKGPAKGSPRFGMLSHHSFFSRHNPHPNRVTHIQEGLNGRPVCTVNDDWYASTPLSPHPLIRSQLPMTVLGAPGIKIPFGDLYGNNDLYLQTGLISEAWREELKDLAAQLSLAASPGTDGKKAQVEEGPVRRATQYSAQTGRIIPASSLPPSRRSTPASRRHSRARGQVPSPAFHDQELMVLELLCQILQTDSLSQVQQWLLLAGQREKDLVMQMIQQAVDVSSLDSRHTSGSRGERFHTQGSPLMRRSFTGRRSNQGQNQESIKEDERPDRIGTAEVLQIHTDKADVS